MSSLFYMLSHLICKITLAGKKLNVPVREIYCLTNLPNAASSLLCVSFHTYSPLERELTFSY